MSNAIPILCYNYNDNTFVEEFPSVINASRKLNIGREVIINSLLGKRQYMKKYIFKYKDKNIKSNKSIISKNKNSSTVGIKLKSKQLGMNVSTASAKLRKIILYNLLLKYEINYCYRCGEKISLDELSIDHKIPYLHSDNPQKLFFDMNNIAFSHSFCNSSVSRNFKKRKHPSSSAYDRGCRCEECMLIKRNSQRKFRENNKKKKI